MASLSEELEMNFFKAYFENPKSVLLLVVVCAFIAILTNALNDIGYFSNLLFSFSYGFPISLIETFLQTRKKKLPESLINVISVSVGALFGSATVYAYLVFNGFIDAGDFGRWFWINFGFGVFMSAVAFYFFWSQYRNQALTLALRNQQLKASELEMLKQQAENRLLQSQMEPHFLFNTLANIQSLVDIDPARAKSMIGHLSQMLRGSLANSASDRCTLDQEMQIVRAYLAIQSVRIGDRLIVEEHIDETLNQYNVLPMSIQPLVENTVKHAVENSISKVKLQVSARRVDDHLCITVQDTGKVTSHKKGHGISLSNIRQRLRNQFGEHASLISEPQEEGWMTVLQLPLEELKK